MKVLGTVGTPLDNLNPSINNTPGVQYIDVHFDRPIDPASFPKTAIKVYYRAPGTSGTQPVIKLLMEDVTILKAPLSGGSGIYTLLAASSKQAATLAFAADNGRLWFVLRPASGAKTVNPGFVSLQTLLAGIQPVR